MADNTYVTLEEFKAWLKIDDTVDDENLERALEAASRMIDQYTDREFYLYNAASARTFRASSVSAVFVDDIGSLSGIVVKTDDDGDGVYETTWDSADYLLEPQKYNNAATPTLRRPVNTIRTLEGYFPIYTDGRPGVEVTAYWGWPYAPPEVQQAALILASRIFRRQNSPEGVIGFNEMGVVRLTPMDRDVLALVLPYKRPVWA